MKEYKRYYYLIYSGQLHRSETCLVSGNIKPEQVKLIFLYLQHKAFNDITYDIELRPKDVSSLLVDFYGFKEERLVLVDEMVHELNLLNTWNESIDKIEFPIDDYSIMNINAEYKLIDIYNNYSKDFIFINASLNLPKWGFELFSKPLSLHITHNGALIRGINMLDTKEKEKIKKFYNKAIFYGDEGIFFDFNDFPPYKYSFCWDGRHITICQVREYEDAPTEVLREMKIGYYLTSEDLALINIKLKNFEMLKRMMRLE